MWQYNHVNELSHHGIKGMKWGVRRYQNKDGSLTPAGKKRVSKQYKKVADKVTEDLNNNYEKMYVKTYNKAAGYMNDTGIDKFNKRQEKKYGKDFAKRSGYDQDFENEFNKMFDRFANQTLSEFYDSNKNYQEAKRLVDEYGMTKWDDLAKSNEETVAKVRQLAKKYGD